MNAARAAIEHLINRIRRDARLAYYFDPLTESMGLLTAALAEIRGESVESVRAEIYPTLRYEEPRCRDCPPQTSGTANG